MDRTYVDTSRRHWGRGVSLLFCARIRKTDIYRAAWRGTLCLGGPIGYRRTRHYPDYVRGRAGGQTACPTHGEDGLQIVWGSGVGLSSLPLRTPRTPSPAGHPDPACRCFRCSWRCLNHSAICPGKNAPPLPSPPPHYPRSQCLVEQAEKSPTPPICWAALDNPASYRPRHSPGRTLPCSFQPRVGY